LHALVALDEIDLNIIEEIALAVLYSEEDAC